MDDGNHPSRSRSVCSPRGALPVSVQPRPAGSLRSAAVADARGLERVRDGTELVEVERHSAQRERTGGPALGPASTHRHIATAPRRWGRLEGELL